MLGSGSRQPVTTSQLPSAVSPREHVPVMPVLRVLPGKPESAATARAMARQLLGDDHPAADTVMLVVSELVTNAVMHSWSGAPGGTVTVALCPGSAGVLIQVRDNGGSSEPHMTATPETPAEHGYGLLLVSALADCWGSVASTDGRVTWCRVGADQHGRRDG